MRLSASRRLDVPAEQAWSLLVDWERQGEWMPATQVRIVGEAGTGLGAQLRASTGIGPARIVDPMRITVWDPHTLCVVQHNGRILRGDGTSFRSSPPGRPAA